MADQLITLRPSRGDDVEIDGTTYRLGLTPDWGESSIDASLLDGPDITGAVAGTRRLLTRERSLTVQIRANDAETYLEAAEALAACVSNIQRYGGTIVRQLALGDSGDISEALECEILEAGVTEAEDGWLEAHRLHGEITLNFTTQPAWLADWTEAASVEASSDTCIELAIPALRGNLPAPGFVLAQDNAGAGRRFWELGGAFENYHSGMTVEFRAGAAGGDFTLANGSAVTTSITDRIGTHSISVSPILPAWTTVATIPDLPNTGANRVRARCLCEDDVTVTVRALWRSGTGAWNELDSAEIPANGWWDLALGTLVHVDSAETIEVRFDIRGSEVVPSSEFFLNLATVTPCDVYAVARGLASEGISEGASAFDSMAADDTDMASRSAQQGGAWTAFGSGDHFTDSGAYYQEREDEDASLTAGRGYILNSLSATTSQTVGVGVTVKDSSVTHTSLAGAVFRYVDSSNFGLCAVVKPDSVTAKYLAVYKVVGGTMTVVEQHSISSAVGHITISVNTDGEFEVFRNNTYFGINVGDLLFSGSDPVFGTGGTLDDGKMGFYGASTDPSNDLRIYNFVGYGSASPAVLTYAVREDALGGLSREASTTADVGFGNPQDVYSEGRRIYLPPKLPGLISSKFRTSDSEVEVDAGHSNSTDLQVLYRPAFASLSDALE